VIGCEVLIWNKKKTIPSKSNERVSNQFTVGNTYVEIPEYEKKKTGVTREGGRGERSGLRKRGGKRGKRKEPGTAVRC